MSKRRHWLTIGAVAVGLAFQVGCGGGGGPSQDFIVGTWELYALSDSFSGEKVPAEEAGMFYTMTASADGTWVDFGSGPGVPPQGSAGTWEKAGDDYIIYQPGEDDVMLYREGSQLYYVGLVEGFGLVWAWLHKA